MRRNTLYPFTEGMPGCGRNKVPKVMLLESYKAGIQTQVLFNVKVQAPKHDSRLLPGVHEEAACLLGQ